jgi:type IV secretory pathway TrbD component
MMIALPSLAAAVVPTGGGVKVDGKVLMQWLVAAGIGAIIWKIARANTVATAEEDASDAATQVAENAAATVAVGAFA